jgi:hypothetical protein
MTEEVIVSTEIEEMQTIADQVSTNSTSDWGFPNEFHVYVLNDHNDWNLAFQSIVKLNVGQHYLINDNGRYILSCTEDLPVDGDIIAEKLK